MTDTTYRDRSTAWRAIDGKSASQADYLEMMTKVIGEQKRQALDSLNLAPGMSVIEVGCGLGRDAEALAARVGPSGKVVAIDASGDLIAQATARTASLGLPLTFQVGDAQALAFPDSSFDAARIERVLEHLVDPAKAVREMARVVRPGGRISVLEPDFESISLGGVELAVTRAVVRYKVDVVIAHGTIGREVRRLLVEAGCRDVLAEQGSFTFGTLALADRVLSLRPSLDGAVKEGWITAEQSAAWWSGLEAHDRAGSFFGAMCGVIAQGTVA